MKEPATRPCGACCGAGTSNGQKCIHCGGDGLRRQAPYECKHFIDDWRDCNECYEETEVVPLRASLAAACAEAERLRVALKEIIGLAGEAKHFQAALEDIQETGRGALADGDDHE